MTEIIKDENNVLLIIHRDTDWEKGLNFLTPNELFIQVGTWWYNKGKKLENHIHRTNPRTVERTMESIYVKRGSLKVTLFTENRRHFGDYFLEEGDLAIFGYGGHGYEILSEDTQIIESKNGPFLNVNKDKFKFEE